MKEYRIINEKDKGRARVCIVINGDDRAVEVREPSAYIARPAEAPIEEGADYAMIFADAVTMDYGRDKGKMIAQVYRKDRPGYVGQVLIRLEQIASFLPAEDGRTLIEEVAE